MAGKGGKFLFKSLFSLPPMSHCSFATAKILAPNPAETRAPRELPPSTPFSVAEYLVHTCGLSKEEAEAVSPDLTHLRSRTRPDAVLRFLRDRGLADKEIAAFVSRKPRLLRVLAKSDLHAKFDFLVGVGFSAAEVAVILQKTDLLSAVPLGALKKRVEFLLSIISNSADLKKVVKKANWVLTGPSSMERRIADNISKLTEWGVSSEHIKALLRRAPRFFQFKPDVIDDAAAAVEGEFGISRGSKSFARAVVVLSSVPESARQSKYEVFESFGWNKSDIVVLFRNFPFCFGLGVATITKHLEFFMNRAGISAASILKCAPMLGFSLERRILPRYELLCALKAKNIPSKKLKSSLYAALSLSEKDFRAKFVNEFMELEPDVCQVYMTSTK